MSGLEREIERRLELARTIAREAAEGTCIHFYRADLQVEQKKDRTPVTIADREAEQFLRKRIAAAFSEDGIEGGRRGSLLMPGRCISSQNFVDRLAVKLRH